MSVYLLGQVVRITGTFRTTSTQALVDPATVVFHVLPLGGSKQTYTYGVDSAVVRESTGVYHIDYTPGAATSYTCDIVSSGTSVTVEEASFSVQSRAIV